MEVLFIGIDQQPRFGRQPCEITLDIKQRLMFAMMEGVLQKLLIAFRRRSKRNKSNNREDKSYSFATYLKNMLFIRNVVNINIWKMYFHESLLMLKLLVFTILSKHLKRLYFSPLFVNIRLNPPQKAYVGKKRLQQSKFIANQKYPIPNKIESNKAILRIGRVLLPQRKQQSNKMIRILHLINYYALQIYNTTALIIQKTVPIGYALKQFLVKFLQSLFLAQPTGPFISFKLMSV